jgi:pimeloyl-ACP methyl ester carboxylesterase
MVAAMGTAIHEPRPPANRRLVRTALFAAATYALVGIGCASFQRNLIYFPPVFETAAVYQSANSKQLTLWTNRAGESIGWKRLSSTQPAEGQVLIMHGNAGCAFQCAHYADAIQKAAPLDVYLVEYPGYADRTGSPSEQALYESAEEGFEALPLDRPTFLVGESLGTGVATYLAGRHAKEVAGVALLAPYNRLADVAQAHLRIFPANWILCDRFPSEDYLRDYQGPVAVLAAGRDRVVPERFAQRLYDGYGGPKKLWRFPDANHESLMAQTPEVWKSIIDFWKGRGRSISVSLRDKEISIALASEHSINSTAGNRVDIPAG